MSVSGETVTKWVYGILGVLYIGWAIGYLIWGATGGPPSVIAGQTFLYALVGAALLVEGILLLISLFLWQRETRNQIENEFVYGRWIRWGISQTLIFVVLYYAACLDDTSAIYPIGFAAVSVGLAFAQSTNEALNCDDTATEKGRTGGATWMPRIEAYIVATLLFLFLAFAYIARLASVGAPDGGSWAIVLVPLIVYFILHFLILVVLTNYHAFGWRQFLREVPFIVTQFIILITVSVITSVPGLINAPCP